MFHSFTVFNSPRRIHSLNYQDYRTTFSDANNIEQAKIVCRDLLGADPERMNPENFTKYCEQVFLRKIHSDMHVFIEDLLK